jgi:hypothetical protein
MKFIFIIFLHFFFVCPTVVLAGYPDGPLVPDRTSFFHRFRAEGTTLKQQLLNGIPYLYKYIDKRNDAPKEAMDYFARQRQMIPYLFPSKGLGSPVKLALVGDLMWVRSDWDTFVDDRVRNYLHSFDAVLGNLESPMDVRKKLHSFWIDYSAYNSDPRLIDSFSIQGRSPFAVLSTANNHTLDQGDEGAWLTKRVIRERGILDVGVRTQDGSGAPLGRSWVEFNRQGIRIGVYAATWGQNKVDLEASTKLKIEKLNGIAPENEDPIDISDVKQAMLEMDVAGIDFKVVMPHWGHEYEFYPSQKIVQMGHAMAQAGADLVVGSHPHVQQPAETCVLNGYSIGSGTIHSECDLKSPDGRARKSYIIYSMGNFTTAIFTFYCKLGLIKELSLYRDPATSFVDWWFPRSTFVINWNPVRRSQQRRLLFADDLMEELDRRGEAVHVNEDYPRKYQWVRSHIGADLEPVRP